MSIKALRGAVQLTADDRSEMLEAVKDLLQQMMERNNLAVSDLISVFFTSTPDLVSEFPAVAARELGMGEVPLMCSVEIDVTGALPRVVRVMMHANSPLATSEIKHIYIRGAEVLRRDLAQ
jgi:chorismate mutase